VPHTSEWRRACVQVLAALGTGAAGDSNAADVLAAIAEAEIPHHLCDGLVGTLLAGIQHPATSAEVRVAALEAVGQICENVAAEVLSRSGEEGNAILAAIIGSLANDESSMCVVLTPAPRWRTSPAFLDAHTPNPLAQ